MVAGLSLISRALVIAYDVYESLDDLPELDQCFWTARLD